ncbi:hypothetical protein RJT34_22990 [Clitoria ternatea]|uniref:Pectinesterase n=1 Tax=Clitoria ternatea TaxID=43366 RepID=A0AAN9FLP4_CLITE
MAGEDGSSGRRIAIISMSTFLLVAMVIAVTIGMNLNQDGSDDENNKAHVASTMKAVKTLCQPTDYRKECVETLAEEAGNVTDPRELIKLAFNITIKKITNGMQKTDTILELEKDPRAKMALDTCKKLMDLSIYEFTRSMDEMGILNLDNLDKILTSLRVWLSGAITYQYTCLDGFENTTSEAGDKMKRFLTTAMRLSSNALAIITELSKTVSYYAADNDDGRRLFQDFGENQEYELGHGDKEIADFPSWVDEVDEGAVGIRRLLGKKKKLKANAVVAKDGSGKFRSINEALKKVPKHNKKFFVIYIKKGVYREYVEVTTTMRYVVFVGEGGQKTRITGNKNYKDGINTYNTPTVSILGDHFVAINMGFENSAGPKKFQAVAIRVQGDKSIFYKCSMDGYQDTLYAHTMRQYYRDCTISGTIDFVFGDGVAFFQNCTFVVRKALKNQQCIVTAQGRKEKDQPSGIVIQGGAIIADENVELENEAYLARPWKNYSRTIFMDAYLGDLIQPDGYMPWPGPTGLTGMNTCFYAEYNNIGPGSDKSKRVKWKGIKTLTSKSVSDFLPSEFFNGDEWIKVTKIPYSSGNTSHKNSDKD